MAFIQSLFTQRHYDLKVTLSLVWGGKKNHTINWWTNRKQAANLSFFFFFLQLTFQIISFITLKHWVLNWLLWVHPGSSEGAGRWQSTPQQAQGPASPPRTGKVTQITQVPEFAQEMCHSAKICLTTDRQPDRPLTNLEVHLWWVLTQTEFNTTQSLRLLPRTKRVHRRK